MANSLPPGSDTTTKSRQRHFDSNDEPILPGKDNLGYAAYAEVLTNRIMSAQPPVTIGISGNWGSGKTSLMNLIQSKLSEYARTHQVFCRVSGNLLGDYESREDIPEQIPCDYHDGPERKHTPDEYLVERVVRKSIWVNVWQLNSQEEVWDAFVQSLVTQVRKEMKWWKRIRFKAAAKQLLRSGYLLVLAIVPAVAGTYLGKSDATWTDVFQLLTFNGPFNAPAPMTGALLTYGLALWAVRQPIKAAWQFDIKTVLVTGSYEARITELGNLSKQFAEFVEALVGKNGRLVVFIDDLDRCSPRVIPQVLEAIKLFAATENCIYVLGVDYGAVWKAIKEGHSFANEEDGARYLEKIIQIPFQLPALSPAAVRFYLRELFPRRDEGLDKYLDDEVKEVFALGLESNPRVLKRAVQIYYTWMDLAERGLKRWEVDPVEPQLVAKWLTIQSRYPKVSDFVARRKDHLLWLERNALHKASVEGRLSKDDTRVWPEAGPRMEDAPELDPVAEDNLDALLILGKHRFSGRPYCDTLDSYIYLGGTAGGLADDVRAQSRERSMLLSPDVGERQKFINQLMAYQGIGKYRYLWSRSGKVNAYRERLQSVTSELALVPADENLYASLAETALTREITQDEDSLYIPPRDHVLGSAGEEIERAIADGLDPELAERERARPIIHIPGFRIGRYPVGHWEFQQFLEATNGSGKMAPFGIVEYEAYSEPFCETRWKSGSPPDIDLPRPKGGELRLNLDLRSDKLEARLIEGGDADTVSIPLVWRGNGVLRADGLIVLVTIGDAYTIEKAGQAVEGTYQLKERFTAPSAEWQPVEFEVFVKAWRTDQSICLDRNFKVNDRYERGLGGELNVSSGWQPVTNVSWEDGVAYCIWLSERNGKPYRLPKEPEWEAAATGDGHFKNIYPWGDVWNPALANTQESGRDRIVEVDNSTPDGDSAFAVANMAGNVWEWCADVFGEVRDTSDSGLLWDDVRFRSSAGEGQIRITRSARGGSFRDTRAYARTTCRNSFAPDHKSASVGFRVAIASELEGLENK